MNSRYRLMSLRTLVACLVIFTYSCNQKGLAMPAADKAESGPIVSAPAGQVEGVVEGNLHVFKGIRYAEPPVGAARWTPPRSMPPWSDVRKAAQFGFACVQPSRTVASIYADDIGTVSEDCLTLNIWAPADVSDAPVLVWFHGGALTRGSSGLPFYDGTRLAEQGIVFVSVNFRIGIFGYLAHPELSAESPLGISGNYGILD
ncbi:MAG: carboxylesterase family protein, partial [Lysobacterales bacterium]